MGKKLEQGRRMAKAGPAESPENFQGMYKAHCAVIFAIAQLSCTVQLLLLHYHCM